MQSEFQRELPISTCKPPKTVIQALAPTWRRLQTTIATLHRPAESSPATARLLKNRLVSFAITRRGESLVSQRQVEDVWICDNSVADEKTIQDCYYERFSVVFHRDFNIVSAVDAKLPPVVVANGSTPTKTSVRCHHHHQTSVNVEDTEDTRLELCCSFMFRSKRSILVKRLSKTVANEAERAVESVLKSLHSSQLETLALSVDSRGAETSPCLLLPDVDMRLGRRTIPARVLFCQLYRWPDLKSSHELKRLMVCNDDHQPSLTCCNPFHWCRLYKPDSPPPPYTKHPQEFKKYLPPPCDSVSQETGGTNYSHVSGSGEPPHWCKIAYWEQSTRVGRMSLVQTPAINVFSDIPQGEGLCLGTLAQTRCTKINDVLEVRKRIGLGVTIFRENQEVYVYNRSEYSIFVNSHTLDPPNSKTLSVYKVMPGFCIKIFDYERLRNNLHVQDSAVLDEVGPFDPYAVRISFIKGWGSKYSRRCITCCPCWLEVIFRVDR